MKRLAAGLLLCLTAMPAMAAPWFEAESETLHNGLHVVVLPNHRSPIVHTSVWYKTGGANDPDGQSGIAHYLEHLMFRGNDTLKDGEYSQTIKSWGGDDNAFTSMDVTSYFATIPADKLEKQLRMEAGRMQEVAPDPKKAATEHDVIQQERAQVIVSDPNRLFGEQVNAQLYPLHPYGRPIIGTPRDISALRLEDAIAFHDKWYGPDNAILVIAGDVEPKRAIRMARAYFGGIDRVNPPFPAYKAKPPLADDTDITVQKCDARIEQPLLGLNWTLPPRKAVLQEALTADVLAYILNGGSTNPLYKALVEEDKRVTALSVAYGDNLNAVASFEINAWPAPRETDYTALNKHIIERLRDVITNDLTEADVARAISQMKLQYELASDEPDNLAMQIGYRLAQGDRLDFLLAVPSLMDAVTLADLRRFAERTLFNPERGVAETRLLPQKDPQCQK
jgi:zinc protease